ncbi:hypothetical protein Scep_015155 [Stephania cephalantha]|uniref:Uncharacterized protein n=1 Tax=Stephania cephalantha TaxID=152367 RepID=A0AAP0P171_9MAGN
MRYWATTSENVEPACVENPKVMAQGHFCPKKWAQNPKIRPKNDLTNGGAEASGSAPGSQEGVFDRTLDAEVLERRVGRHSDGVSVMVGKLLKCGAGALWRHVGRHSAQVSAMNGMLLEFGAVVMSWRWGAVRGIMALSGAS